MSTEAKTLIRGLLKTDPMQRLSIDQVMESDWIKRHQQVPATPLATLDVLREEMEEGGMWPEVQVSPRQYYQLYYIHSFI